MMEREVSVPFSGQTLGRLRAHGGLRDFWLGSGEGCGLEAPYLVHGLFDGTLPRVRVEGGSVELGYSRWAGFLCAQGGRLDLHPGLPWRIEIHGGSSGLHARLGDLSLSALSIYGGVSDVLIELPWPEGRVTIDVHGGAERLTLVRPHGAALCVQAQGGAANVLLDDTYLGSVGGGLRWCTEGGGQDGYYDVRIHGGASRLVIAREHVALDPRDERALSRCTSSRATST
jgi:hypothetical protein